MIRQKVKVTRWTHRLYYDQETGSSQTVNTQWWIEDHSPMPSWPLGLDTHQTFSPVNKILPKRSAFQWIQREGFIISSSWAEVERQWIQLRLSVLGIKHVPLASSWMGFYFPIQVWLHRCSSKGHLPRYVRPGQRESRFQLYQRVAFWNVWEIPKFPWKIKTISYEFFSSSSCKSEA